MMKNRSEMQSMHRQEVVTAWLMVAPSLSLLALFMLGPAIISLGLAFTNRRFVPGPLPTRFIGFENFARLIQDETFFQALRNNMVFTVLVVPLQCGLALMLAILVNQKMRWAKAFRTIYFSPIAIAMPVVSVVWVLLFNPQGMINLLLQTISGGLIPQITWLRDPSFAMAAILVVSIWSSVGFQMVIFLAGLQEIPRELYQAASIDGANMLQQFRHITIPQLRNTTVFVVVTTTILAFRLYTQVEVMTSGGPRGATNTVVRYMVETGFRASRIGYASAITIIFLIVVLTISLVQRRILHSERM